MRVFFNAAIVTCTLLGSLATAACKDASSTDPDARLLEPPVATSIRVVSGSWVVLPTLSAAAPIVVVYDQLNRPFVGGEVRCAITFGGGTVAPIAITDSIGRARCDWRTGPTEGRTTMTASIAPSNSVAFEVHAVSPGPAGARFKLETSDGFLVGGNEGGYFELGDNRRYKAVSWIGAGGRNLLVAIDSGSYSQSGTSLSFGWGTGQLLNSRLEIRGAQVLPYYEEVLVYIREL